MTNRHAMRGGVLSKGARGFWLLMEYCLRVKELATQRSLRNKFIHFNKRNLFIWVINGKFAIALIIVNGFISLCTYVRQRQLIINGNLEAHAKRVQTFIIAIVCE